MQPYYDPRYYALLKRHAPAKFHGEMEHAKLARADARISDTARAGFDKQIAAIVAGGDMEAAPDFDPTIPAEWRDTFAVILKYYSA